MTIRNAIEAMLQRLRYPSPPDAHIASHTPAPASVPTTYIGDDPWLMELHDRLQSELDGLYEKANQNDTATRQRIALILRTFHRMETGDYGQCACCEAVISRERLEADPTHDTCEKCM